jgi:PAS domain S-box-containing protein
MARTLRALIVEASPEDARIVQELQRAGFNVVSQSVQTRPDIEAALQHQRWDVVVSGSTRPGADLAAMLAIVREKSPHVPCICIADALREDLAAEALRNGAFDSLTWNNLHRLGSVVERALAENQRLRELTTAEEALRLSERKYRKLFESLLDAAVLVAVETGRIIDANPAAEVLLGWGRAELMGMNHQRLYPADSAAADGRRFMEAVAPGGVPEYETLIVDRRGRGIPVAVIVAALELQGHELRYGLLHDIRERKRAEERQALQYTVTRILAEAGLRAEVLGKLARAIGESAGWDLVELCGIEPGSPHPRRWAIWHRADPRLANFKIASEQTSFLNRAAALSPAWRQGQTEWLTDLAAAGLTPAQHAGLQGALHAPLLHQGSVIGVLKLYTSVAREPDPVLARLIEGLGGQIAQYLERTHVELQLRQSQKLEAIGELAHGVAHDFNNQLTVITGNAHLLLLDQQMSPDQAGCVKDITTAAKRASTLTQQLLAFSRRQVMHASVVNLNQVIRDFDLMLSKLSGTNIQLQTNLAGGLPAIRADEGMLGQVLLNLVVRARDAMPEGGQITVDTSLELIDAAEVQRNPEAIAGQFVRLTVKDNGPAMRADVLARIFEPFLPAEDTRSKASLGLATVYGIVRQHRGWIDVQSRKSEGTTFRAHFPVAALTEEPEPVVAPKRVATGGSETILLVEDEDAVRLTTAQLLRRGGYQVIEAASGTEALHLWDHLTRKVDLLLTDIVMPDGITGRELAAQLRSRAPDLKIIFTSGYALNLPGLESELIEGKNFLHKPFEADRLATVVRDCLDAAAHAAQPAA